MGLLILKLIRHHLASKVAIAEPVENKRTMALRFGADQVFDPNSPTFFTDTDEFSEGLGFDVVIESSGNQGSAQRAHYFVARGGNLIFYGLYGMNFELPLNLFSLYWKDITINAVYPSVTNFQKAVEIARHLSLEELITAEFPFHMIDEAFREKASGNHAKVMINFDHYSR